MPVEVKRVLDYPIAEVTIRLNANEAVEFKNWLNKMNDFSHGSPQSIIRDTLNKEFKGEISRYMGR